jgi:hypothetical protein
MAAKVFISYRRGDSAGYAGRLKPASGPNGCFLKEGEGPEFPNLIGKKDPRRCAANAQ